MKTTRKNLKRDIEFQSLEDRRLLVAFGNAWADADALTISFPADGTVIGDTTSNLHATLDEIAERSQWQETVLRAYQTWAVHADINIGLRNDHGNEFGAPGLSTGDPRFGEFRIGALPQIGAIANALPFQAIAGTYSGDLFLNSSAEYTFDDWSDGEANADDGSYDLLSVVLHESGNTLGLADSLNSQSVMFEQYTVPKGALTQEDVQRIQELYGPRVDHYETTSNDQLSVATLVPSPVGFDPASDVIRAGGSLVNSADVDVYRIEPAYGQDTLAIRLKAQGISLLRSQLEVIDSNGQVIGMSQSGSVFANDHSLNISHAQDHAELFVRVSAHTSDVYSVGDYELEFDYRPSEVQAQDTSRSAFDSGADSLFANFGLQDEEVGENDFIESAIELTTVEGFAENTRFEIESSVTSAGDVDYWKVQSPAEVTSPLRISVAGVGLEQPELAIQVVDDTGQPVGATGRLMPDGSWRLQVAAENVKEAMFIRVSVDPNSNVAVGNYVTTAGFVNSSDQLREMTSGSLDSGVDTLRRWTIEKSKLFRFNLSAFGDSGKAVRLTIYDAYSKEVRLSMSASADVTRSALVWLMEGDYIVRFSSATTAAGQVDGDISYQLLFDGVSDDQGAPDSDDYEDGSSYYYYGSSYYYYYYYT